MLLQQQQLPGRRGQDNDKCPCPLCHSLERTTLAPSTVSAHILSMAQSKRCVKVDSAAWHHPWLCTRFASQVGTTTAIVFMIYNIYGQIAVAERVVTVIEFCDEGLTKCGGACSEVRRQALSAGPVPHLHVCVVPWAQLRIGLAPCNAVILLKRRPPKPHLVSCNGPSIRAPAPCS